MGKAGAFRVLFPLLLGLVAHVNGVEQEAEGYTVTASKYDNRSSGIEDDYKGCYTDGCGPELLLDGLLNDVPESRWSCSEDLPGDVEQCYVTFDLLSSQTLSKLSMYFHNSDDLTRQTNPFDVSTSTTGATFVDSFSGVNVAGTVLGVAEEFSFPVGSSGRYVRVTGVLDPDQWLSINEVEVYVDSGSSAAPTPVAVNVTGTASPSAAVTTTATTAPTAAPTPSPTVIGGPECSSVMVSNAGDLSGVYDAMTTTAGELAFQSTGTSAGTIAMSGTGATAVCADSSSNTACVVTEWRITPVATDSTSATYIVFDDAEHPSDIQQLWLRLYDCNDEGGCSSFPADVEILCSDGSTAGSTTPSPVSATASECGVLEVAGTSGAASDGFYYDDGGVLADGVTQYMGYEDVGGELTSNGNMVVAKRINDSACATSTSTVADCTWRQWWIDAATDSEGALDYYTFDESDHPADIAPGTLWYTINGTVFPYDGDVTVTCAPAATPALPEGTQEPTTPSPAASDRSVSTSFPDDDGWTRSPVSGGETPSPALNGSTGATTDGGGDGGDDGDNTAVIAGSVAGGVALLAILGVAAYKLKKPPPPPPSYDDLVGA